MALAGRRFDAAMAEELLAWNTRGVYTEEAATGQHVISTRWVLTEKPGELPQDPPKRKARLFVRGFEDPQKASVVSTSPTVGRASLCVLLDTMAVRVWVPRTVDVGTALLQGLPLDQVAPVYVQPPPQARIPTGVVWRLRKCAYGFTDAPRRWYEAVLVLMINLGYDRVEPDHGLFVLVLDGTLEFTAAVHVDHSKYAGVAKEVARFETALRAVFDVGPVRICNLTFTGLRIACDTDASSGKMVIAVDQDHYLESIEEIDVSSERAAGRSAAVSTSEFTLYRRAVVALLWASGQTQPFMACHSSLLAGRFHKAVVHDLLAVNRVVRAARAASGLPLLFTAVAPLHRLVLFADASSITSSLASAQTGDLVLLASDAPVRGSLSPDTPLFLLAWGSHKQRRVTHSSFAAETYALLDGMCAAITSATFLSRRPGHAELGAAAALAGAGVGVRMPEVWWPEEFEAAVLVSAQAAAAATVPFSAARNGNRVAALLGGGMWAAAWHAFAAQPHPTGAAPDSTCAAPFTGGFL